jgi:hypothetical protein
MDQSELVGKEQIKEMTGKKKKNIILPSIKVLEKRNSNKFGSGV